MQRLLATADWDPDLVRDDLRAYVVERGRPGGGAGGGRDRVPQEGATSVGVQASTRARPARSTTASSASFSPMPAQRAGVHRSGAVPPRSWVDDRAGVGPAVSGGGRRAKPQLARVMLERALDAGVPASWVIADEVYGGDPALRRWLEGRGVSYVLAVKGTEPLGTAPGIGAGTAVQVAGRASHPVGGLQRRARRQGPPAVRLGTGRAGRPGCRRPTVAAGASQPPRRRAGLLRCFGPAETSLLGLVRVAGTRWAIEEGFQQAKNEVGLDHYQVRRWPGWYRHITWPCGLPSWSSPRQGHHRGSRKGDAAA